VGEGDKIEKNERIVFGEDRMINRWFGIAEKENSMPNNIYRLGTIFFISIAVSMSVAALWREINQLTTSTYFEQLPLSSTTFSCVLVTALMGMSMFIGWHLMERGSFDGHWQVEKHTSKLFWALALSALLVIFFHGLWSISNWTITIWSLPAISSIILLACICLLVFQFERIQNRARHWGFSMSGFDRRDTVNILVLGFLFFGVSHLVAEYDPLAVGGSQLPLWLLPIFAIASAVSLSTLSAHIVRIPMATAIAGFFMLSIRNTIFAALSLESLGSSVIPVILGPVFVLDLWQWMKSGQASTFSTAITAAIALFFNYPIFDEWMGITFSGQDYLLIIAGAFIVALGTSWLTKQIVQRVETLGEMYIVLDKENTAK